MVARLVAAVEAHERPDRGSIGKAHHIGRDEAQHVHIPARATVEIGCLEHKVPELRDLRRRKRRTLRIVDADRLVRSVVRNGRTNRLRRDRGEAMMHADRDAKRVDEAHDGASAGAICLLDGTAHGLRQRLQVVRGGDRQSEADEPGCVAVADAVDVRGRASSAQEEFVLALRDDEQPKVDEIVPRAVQVGPFEMGIEQRVGLHCRRDAARQFDASRTLPNIGRMIHGRLHSD